jgi:RNA polymerase sigma factor (sigma-70 family)
MRITEWLTPSNPCRKFGDHEQLFQALKNWDNGAVLCLQIKATPFARQLVRQHELLQEQAEDLLNQSTHIFLRKIEAGAYQFQGYAPSTYLIEVMKRVALTMSRKRQKSHELLENHANLHDPDIEAYHRQHESAALVRQFLERMGEPCQSVVRLHHIEGYTDEEVIKQGWTRYTTTDSLKIKRSDCMKKLIEIARQWKISNNT